MWVNIGDKPSIGLSALKFGAIQLQTVFSPCSASDQLDDLWHVFTSQSLSFLILYNVGDVSTSPIRDAMKGKLSETVTPLLVYGECHKDADLCKFWHSVVGREGSQTLRRPRYHVSLLYHSIAQHKCED